MKIAVLKETAAGETRSAAIAETVKKFAALGADVAVESGAGESASVSDDEFAAAGANVGSREDALRGAGIILCVNGPDAKDLNGAKAALSQTVSIVDKMATKGIIHRNTAGRYKSRLAARMSKAGSARASA